MMLALQTVDPSVLNTSGREDSLIINHLPEHLLIDNIISRLDLRSIGKFKCVCKSWRDLIQSHHHHISSSTSSAIALFETITPYNESYKICDEVGVNGCSTIFNFVLPDIQSWESMKLISSTNGLLLLFGPQYTPYICNPITREYIELPPRPPLGNPIYTKTLGFGASRVTSQYKVVMSDCRTNCMIYSLETGLWRSIRAPDWDPIPRYSSGAAGGALLNGNLHWLGFVVYADHDPTLKYKRLTKLSISCFDLETELFTSFYLPRDPDYAPAECLYHFNSGSRCCSLLVFEGRRLCLCDTKASDRILIWSMNRYGDDTSWTKKIIINIQSLLHYDLNMGLLIPVKIFGDSGDVLLQIDNCGRPYYYTDATKSIEKYKHLQVEGFPFSYILDYRPTFFSLKTMGFHNAKTF